jgi:hypothetical protein
MSKRASGWLSSFQLVAAVEGLLRTTEDLKLDPEERRRLEAAQETCGPLEEEAKKSNLVTDPALRVRSCDEVVDRNWGVVFGVLAKLAPLDGVLPVGTEAAKIVRKVFPTKLDFIRKDATVQAQIGRGKLDELEATEMSPELGGLFRPLLKLSRKDHLAYEKAIAEKSDTVKAKGELNPARKATSEALDAFVSYVEIMATTPQKQKRAAAMLAPLDAIIATRRATNVKSSGGEGEPLEPEQEEEQDEDDGSDE